MSINPEDRPKEEDFDKGWEVFLSLVDIIHPNICLVLSKKSFGGLGDYVNKNKPGWEINVPKFEGREKIIILSKNEYSLKLIFIDHPSSPYSSWKSSVESIDRQMNEYATWVREQ